MFEKCKTMNAGGGLRRRLFYQTLLQNYQRIDLVKVALRKMLK
jgi:hypothetical protein